MDTGLPRRAFFIAHPDVVIDPNIPVPHWPLSLRGKERMNKLLAQLWVNHISAVYCSTEQKAIDGAEILAGQLAIGYQMVHELVTRRLNSARNNLPDSATRAASNSLQDLGIRSLGEIDRSSTGYLPFDEHRTVADLFFAHPCQSIRGWEAANDAQQRIVSAIAAILANDQSAGNIAIVSHGGVGTLYLCHLKGIPISRKEGQPGANGGYYYCFEALSRTLLHSWKVEFTGNNAANVSPHPVCARQAALPKGPSAAQVQACPGRAVQGVRWQMGMGMPILLFPIRSSDWRIKKWEG